MTVDGPNGRYQFPTPPPDDERRATPSDTASGAAPPVDDLRRGVTSPVKEDNSQISSELNGERAAPRLASGWVPEAEATIPEAPEPNGDRNSGRSLSPSRLEHLLRTLPKSAETMNRQRSATAAPSTANHGPAPRMHRTLSTPLSTRRSSRSSKPQLEIFTDDKPVLHQHLDDARLTNAASAASAETEAWTSAVDDISTPPKRPRPRRASQSQSTAPGSAPLPFHSYLSLTLGSPTSIIPRRTSPQAAGPDAPAQVYGPPPNHPDDTGAIALERIMNFFTLPPKLEGALMFGLFSCLDSWLYIFTILPLRFLKAVGVLLGYWKDCVFGYFSYDGAKLRKTRRSSPGSEESRGGTSTPVRRKRKKERRTKSDLMPSHKADLLRGAVLFTTCWVLMGFDASRIYHSVRGQSGIKLYVIYNMLDFGDRLCSALGQDIFEALFSAEILERRPDGRSKVWRPFGIFLLALAYNILHSLVLFYQVITLNVAVNSYSNALITLLLSVQFVELKATVFKRFDKENLFQLTCADIVERFQLLLMLVIIWTRNLVEMGVWTLSSSASSPWSGILPKSFTLFPSWTGKLLGPFFLVLGSEMFVDWLKHAYITKFNNFRPVLYERFLDVQCKDYATHAFSDQNLTRRLGLPVLPLASLFIRSTIQTYHMFLATHLPADLPRTTSLAPTPSSTLAGIDSLLRRALSRSTLAADAPTWSDDILAAASMFFFLAACFLVSLAVKLLLGVTLLRFARARCARFRDRDKVHAHTGGRSGGAFGVCTVADDQRARIFEADEKGLRECVERARKGRELELRTDMARLDAAERYRMVSKRIW